MGERALQRIVKNHAQVTQRHAVNFAEQIATRRYETQVLEYVFEDIKPELGLDYEFVENTDIESDELIGGGKYTIRFQACD